MYIDYIVYCLPNVTSVFRILHILSILFLSGSENRSTPDAMRREVMGVIGNEKDDITRMTDACGQ